MLFQNFLAPPTSFWLNVVALMMSQSWCFRFPHTDQGRCFTKNWQCPSIFTEWYSWIVCHSLQSIVCLFDLLFFFFPLKTVTSHAFSFHYFPINPCYVRNQLQLNHRAALLWLWHDHYDLCLQFGASCHHLSLHSSPPCCVLELCFQSLLLIAVN